MKKAKTIVLSIIPLFISIILFVLSLVLNISDFSPNDTHLMFILPLRYCSYCLFMLFVLLVIIGIFHNKTNIKKANKILLIVSLISIILSISVPALSFNSYEYGYDIFEDEHLVDEQLIDRFPYYQKMVELNGSNEGVMYLYEEYSVLGTEYIHIQNSLDLLDTSPIYNIEYFETNSNILLYQFRNEKRLFEESEIYEYQNIKLDVYKNENSLEIRIDNDDALYSYYVSDFDYISNDYNDLVDKAINEYLSLTNK